MRIGIAYDLKPDAPPPHGSPDDIHEEFDSPVTVRAVAEALRSLGHEPIELGDGKPLIEALLHSPPDLVFNFAEGTGTSRSREARVPAVCEMLGIPYTGSDPLALAVALDKSLCRRIAESAGVTIPKGFTFAFPPGEYDGDFAEFPAMLEESGLGLPVIAKPVCEGSSKGIRGRCLIQKPEDLGPTLLELWNNYHQPVLVEEFIAGDELTVAVIGNDPPQPLGVMRIVPRQPTEHFVYSLEVKRDYLNLVDYEIPPKLPRDLLQNVESDALAVFDALGCRDLARADFRIRDGIPYFLEINPLPGLNPESGDLCYLAYGLGLTHPELIRRILDTALTRLGLS